MFKLTVTNVLSVFVGAVVVGTVIYVNVATVHLTTDAPAGDEPAKAVSAGNPLLEATKEDVAKWFPGTCFAEIYMKNPSYKGGLVPGCIDKTAQEIKAQTGVALSADDFRTPEVISHFKGVYGAGNPWRI
ncbi:TPA: hypothetical protein ACUUEN_005488 [Pseudomonas aeruginosa]